MEVVVVASVALCLMKCFWACALVAKKAEGTERCMKRAVDRSSCPSG